MRWPIHGWSHSAQGWLKQTVFAIEWSSWESSSIGSTHPKVKALMVATLSWSLLVNSWGFLPEGTTEAVYVSSSYGILCIDCASVFCTPVWQFSDVTRSSINFLNLAEFSRNRQVFCTPWKPFWSHLLPFCRACVSTLKTFTAQNFVGTLNSEEPKSKKTMAKEPGRKGRKEARKEARMEGWMEGRSKEARKERKGRHEARKEAWFRLHTNNCSRRVRIPDRNQKKLFRQIQNKNDPPHPKNLLQNLDRTINARGPKWLIRRWLIICDHLELTSWWHAAETFAFEFIVWLVQLFELGGPNVPGPSHPHHSRKTGILRVKRCHSYVPFLFLAGRVKIGEPNVPDASCPAISHAIPPYF